MSKKILFALVAACGISSAHAGQFSTLDPAYSQSLFTGAAGGLGLTFLQNGQLVVRNDFGAGANVLSVYSPTADTTYQGTSVHSFTNHVVSGLGTSGRGITTGLDGSLYANSSSGIQRVDTSTWTATTFAGSHSGAYGIAVDAAGMIIHNDSSNIWSLNPLTGIDTLLYAAGSFIDGIAIASTGEIFLADLGGTRVKVISSTGTLINDVAVSHGPDGMAFGGGAAYANNTDGTITKLTFAGPGYTGAVTQQIIASGGAYGDLATVGPDCAFYVTQYGPIGGIHWDNGTTTSDIAVVRLATTGTSCGFELPPGIPPPPTGTPAPGTLALMGIALLGLGYTRSRKTA